MTDTDTDLITTASIPPPATSSFAIPRSTLKSKSTIPPQSSSILDPPISRSEQTAPSVLPPRRGVTLTMSVMPDSKALAPTANSSSNLTEYVDCQ